MGDNGQPDVSRVQAVAARLAGNISQVIVGKRPVIELALVALLAEGHLLIEDVPGLGKTMLAKAIARSLGGTFKRIQFTPDLLPSDVTGIYYFNQKRGDFEFRPGPIMSHVILADEINRATPRTQSCLLECMQERQVTVDVNTIPLPRPFLVMATQNPIELEGTFPLPEAQLDRFLLRISLGYPSAEEETAILERFQRANPLDGLPVVTEPKDLLEAQRIGRDVFVADAVRDYIVALTRATRRHPGIQLGASPRASLGIMAAAQALAAIRGRGFVTPDDVKYLVAPTLAHRLILKTEARLKGQSLDSLLAEITATVPVPVET